MLVKAQHDFSTLSGSHDGWNSYHWGTQLYQVWSKPFNLSLYEFKADHFYILIRLYKHFNLIRSQTTQHIFKLLYLLQKKISFYEFQTYDLLYKSHVTLLLD